LRGHCAAGAARTAKLARRAKGRSPQSEKSNQREGHPDTAVSGLGNCSCVALPPASMQSSCPPTAQRDSGRSPAVHPWTGVELGAIHCAHPTGYLGNCSCVALPPASMQSPPSRCRCIGGPDTAHPAQPSQSGFPQAGALGFGFAFGIGAHDARPTGSPRSRRGCAGIVRRMAHTMWASSMPVHGWTVSEPRSGLAHPKHRDCA
jgi:hypothetical protein